MERRRVCDQHMRIAMHGTHERPACLFAAREPQPYMYSAIHTFAFPQFSSVCHYSMSLWSPIPMHKHLQLPGCSSSSCRRSNCRAPHWPMSTSRNPRDTCQMGAMGGAQRLRGWLLPSLLRTHGGIEVLTNRLRLRAPPCYISYWQYP